MMCLSEKFRSEQVRFCAHVLFLSLSTLEITRCESSCQPISATQSNTWGMGDASRAIDNDTSTCSVSADFGSASLGWWQTDLGSVYTVYSVTVTSGYDLSHNGSWPNYVQNFSISVGMTNNTEIVKSDLCYYYNDECFLKAGIASTFVCSNPLMGRYVTLKRRGGNRQDAISLCEVSIQCEQPPSSSSTSASYISSVSSSHLSFSTSSTTSAYRTAETTHASSTSLEASAIAAIVLGSVLLLSLVINVVLIFRLTQLKRMLQNQQDLYTVPKTETNNEQPNQYATLRSNSRRDSIFPATGEGENYIYRNAYELDVR